MAKNFKGKEAERLIKASRYMLQKLYTAKLTELEYRTQVKNASDALVDEEVLKLLRDMPIEEINRNKNGFRVKSLRDYGFSSIADLVPASVGTICSVKGISEDGAIIIKQIVSSITEKTREGLKIKLSLDNRSPEATNLILALSKLRLIRLITDDCDSLYALYKRSITESTEDLAKSNGLIRWFFAVKEKKQRANDAYDYLLSEYNGEFGERAGKLIDELDYIDTLPANEAWQDFSENSVAFFNELEEINPGILGNDDLLYGLPEELAEEIQNQEFKPEGLLCELRRYQEWGVKYALHQERVLLGDEMGLGKTVQAIATMVSLRNTGASHFMVVCPASVIMNWCREIKKMSLLTVTKAHGIDRDEALRTWYRVGGVLVTTYETTQFIEFTPEFRFSMLVVDEAHYIKNPEARRTVNVKAIAKRADRLLFMTGTAIENNVNEMIELIKILNPSVAGKISKVSYMHQAPQFREMIAPVYYRRRRNDVLTELPDLIEQKEWCIMGDDEEAVYEEAVLSRNYTLARRVSWCMDDLSKSSKARRLLEIVEEAKEEGRKVIVFSFFLDTINKVSKLLGERCTDPINGSVPPNRRQEIIDEFDKAPAGKVLVAQIQSGGTGLNIQAASVVVLCEPQFKPSIENQAISRAYRMGQTRNVLVFRLLCDDTVDEKIMDVLEDKQAIFNAFADVSAAADETKEIDDNTFGNIIKEEIDRINQKNGSKDKNV